MPMRSRKLGSNANSGSIVKLNLKASESSVTVLPRLLEKNSYLAIRRRPRPNLQLRGTGKHDSIADLERRHGAWSMHRDFFPIAVTGLTVSSESRNSDLDRRWYACWYVGFLA
jgi:hypothetical protein